MSEPTKSRPRDDWRLRIARLELKPGDKLVAQTVSTPSSAAQANLREYLETCTPAGVRVLILDQTVTLGVISGEPVHG